MAAYLVSIEGLRGPEAQIWYGEPGEFVGCSIPAVGRLERLGSVMWFYESGPFYAHAVDLREPEVIRRIGPCSTLEGGKAAVEKVVEGREDVSGRAGYAR